MTKYTTDLAVSIEVEEYATVTATVTAPGAAPVTEYAGSVPVWSLPLTPEWKRTYREAVLMGMGHYPRSGDGWRVTFSTELEPVAE